jgi:branched-chain amino acid transport system permease protein
LAGSFFGQVMLTVGLFTLMGMGLNLEIGLAGLLDMGFVAFFATGAYTIALLTADNPYTLHIPIWPFNGQTMNWWEALPFAMLASLVMGFMFGIPVLKVRGDYLAVATLGLGEIIRIIVLSDTAEPLLGGSQGLLHIPSPVLFGVTLQDPNILFYLTLIASIIAAWFAWALENSRLGRAWMAIREDEDVGQALGINLVNVKMLAYGLGAVFAGLAGAIFAIMLGSIFPHSFQLLISINILALIIVGGIGSLPGVVVGAAMLMGTPELLREFGEFRYLVYGFVLILMMRVKPIGLWPSAARKRELQTFDEAQTIATAQGSAQKA